jgi:hypothetical protein
MNVIIAARDKSGGRKKSEKKKKIEILFME